ncbi:unnamed protein product [Linum trigynum]|uniref:Uncharacterized protein n=1 Tax=Linum trigynum TaxID=586398 RepID=A0AAV2ED74_9ROSI
MTAWKIGRTRSAEIPRGRMLMADEPRLDVEKLSCVGGPMGDFRKPELLVTANEVARVEDRTDAVTSGLKTWRDFIGDLFCV